MSEKKDYQLAIIGAGPAGASASVYAARFGIRHVVIGSIMGGQISESHLIDNYIGVEDATGFEFAQKLTHHVQKYGTEIIPKLVKNVEKNEAGFVLDLGNDEKIAAKTLLLATGTQRRKLMIPGEERLAGKGVSYCATCDGFFYKQKTVAVIGGSDSAAGAAVYLADIAAKVYIIYRGQQLRAEPHWIKKIEDNAKIEIIYNTTVSEIRGETKVAAIETETKEKQKNTIQLDGIFIEAGSDPNMDFSGRLHLDTDEQGYIKIKSDAATSLSGVWAAGDITDGSDKFRQVVTAAAEGAIAARSIYNYLKKNDERG